MKKWKEKLAIIHRTKKNMKKVFLNYDMPFFTVRKKSSLVILTLYRLDIVKIKDKT